MASIFYSATNDDLLAKILIKIRNNPNAILTQRESAYILLHHNDVIDFGDYPEIGKRKEYFTPVLARHEGKKISDFKYLIKLEGKI